MVKALRDILANKWEEPPEIQAIKDFVRKNYQADVAVGISSNNITVNADSAALAATLRMNILDLQKAAKTDKKLLIRIG